MSETQRCAGRTWHDRMGSFPCANKGKVKEEGKLWCRTHAPSLVAARRQARSAKWEAEWKESREHQAAAKAEQAEIHRRAECYPALLEAAKAELDAGEGACYAECAEGRPCATCQLRAAIEAAS